MQPFEQSLDKPSSSPTRKCPRCLDRGFCIVGVGDGTFTFGPCPEAACEAGRVALRQQTEARLRSLFEQADVPVAYQNARLMDFDRQPDALRIARAALDEGTSLLLWGSVGTGKTHMAYACLNEKLQAGVPGLAIEVPDLLARLTLAFRDNAEYEKVIDTLRRTPILVLDDLGVEKKGDWQEEVIFRVVSGRNNRGLPTIATTNLRPDQLAEHIGMRAVSRLREGYEIHFEGADRRRRAAVLRSEIR